MLVFKAIPLLGVLLVSAMSAEMTLEEQSCSGKALERQVASESDEEVSLQLQENNFEGESLLGISQEQGKPFWTQERKVKTYMIGTFISYSIPALMSCFISNKEGQLAYAVIETILFVNLLLSHQLIDHNKKNQFERLSSFGSNIAALLLMEFGYVDWLYLNPDKNIYHSTGTVGFNMFVALLWFRSLQNYQAS